MYLCWKMLHRWGAIIYLVVHFVINILNLCLCKTSHRHLDSLDFEKQHKMKNINNHHSFLAFRSFMYFGQYQTASCMLLFMFGTFLELQSSQLLE